MPLLNDAWKALRDYPRITAAYALANATIIFLFRLALALAEPLHLSPDHGLGALLRIALLLATGAGVSLVQAVLLARLGRELDKPLWRCPDDADAARRFFLPWFIINLLLIALWQFSERAHGAEQQEIAAFFELIAMLASVLLFPLGVCVMFWGRLEWPELGEALRPITRNLPHAALVFLILLVQQALFVAAYGLRPHISPLFDAVVYPTLVTAMLATIELLAFNAMWIVCILHRNEPDDHEDFDF